MIEASNLVVHVLMPREPRFLFFAKFDVLLTVHGNRQRLKSFLKMSFRAAITWVTNSILPLQKNNYITYAVRFLVFFLTLFFLQ